MTLQRAARGAFILAAAIGAPCPAQDAAPAHEAAPSPQPVEPAPVPPPADSGNAWAWTLRFEPSLWYVSPGGSFEMPDSTVGEIRCEDLNLDSPRPSFFGELQVQQDRYGLLASAAIFDAQDRGAIAEQGGVIDGVPFSTGDRLVTTLEFVSVEAAAWYRFYENPRGEMPGGGFRYRPSWDLLAGGRIYDIGLDIDAPAGRASESAFFAEPYVGIRFSMDLAERFTVDVTGSIGYFNDGHESRSLSWDIIAGFQWSPTNNFGMQIGFRQLAFRLHDGGDQGAFEFNGAMAGLYGGVVLRF